MSEENIFEGFEEEAMAFIRADWSGPFEDMEDVYEIEMTKLLALREERLPINALTLQQLKNLDVYHSLSYDHGCDTADFYESMAGMHGTKVIDGIEYAIMDDFAYMYFKEVMALEVVDPQGKQCVMVYDLVEEREQREQQEKNKDWDSGEDEDNEEDDASRDWEHPGMIVSMMDFRNEVIKRTALELRQNGVPLFVHFLSKRTFVKEVLEKRRIACNMPGISAAFEKISEGIGGDEQLAFMTDKDRIKIFYADSDETIENLMVACSRIADKKEKLTGIGVIYNDTLIERVERALFELIFLFDMSSEEISFVSGIDVQALDAVRRGKAKPEDLAMKDVNRLITCFPELLNIEEWLS